MHHQKVDENLFAALALDDGGGDGERLRSLDELFRRCHKQSDHSKVASP